MSLTWYVDVVTQLKQIWTHFNKTAKLILNQSFYSSSSSALTTLGWKTLNVRRTLHRSIFVFQCLNNISNYNFNLARRSSIHYYYCTFTIITLPSLLLLYLHYYYFTFTIITVPSLLLLYLHYYHCTFTIVTVPSALLVVLTMLGFHIIPRDTEENRHSGHVGVPNKKNNQNSFIKSTPTWPSWRQVTTGN